LILGGLAPFSTLDFPGHLAAVLFTQGCPLACRYCHNPHLRPRTRRPVREWAATMAWLRRRQGLLDGVVISGGEPTAQSGLAGALEQIRALGFATALHTTGAHDRRFAEVLPLLDWVGFDMKASFATYGAITGSDAVGPRAKRALQALLASGVAHEIRTTVHSTLLDATALLAIARDLGDLGVRHWTLQVFRPAGCVDAQLLAEPGSPAMASLLPALSEMVPDICVR
jgi:anaerobic ribonucleoside-triphosphate reductase activating protein